MRYFLIFLSLFLFAAFSSSEVDAWPKAKPVTPYGDYCPQCGKYGTCKDQMSQKDAESAMTEYYRKKGLRINIITIKGRFIKARITEKDDIVDVIIFDRRTGRIRSIY